MRLAMMLKALPLAYSKDLQEDKAPLFRVADSMQPVLEAMTGMVEDFHAQKETMRRALDSGFATATDLADALVMEAGLSFRRAHHAVGKIVALAESKNCALEELPLEAMQKICPEVTATMRAALDIERAVQNRASEGGTAPARVRDQIRTLRQILPTLAPTGSPEP